MNALKWCLKTNGSKVQVFSNFEAETNMNQTKNKRYD